MSKDSSFEIKTVEQIKTALPCLNNKYGITDKGNMKKNKNNVTNEKRLFTLLFDWN